MVQVSSRQGDPKKEQAVGGENVKYSFPKGTGWVKEVPSTGGGWVCRRAYTGMKAVATLCAHFKQRFSKNPAVSTQL